jgi:Uma2 family endonuclease
MEQNVTARSGPMPLTEEAPMTEAAFRKLALEDPEGHWELYCGHAQQKPGMTADHNVVMHLLARQLWVQLEPETYQVRVNSGHVRRSAESYFIPDVYVTSTEQVRPQRGTGELETFRGPLLLVVEVWSPSTGRFDVATKLREYQERGDLEIWRLHPLEHTLIAWRRQADGTYQESHHAGGTVQPTGLPGVAIDLDALFA